MDGRPTGCLAMPDPAPAATPQAEFKTVIAHELTAIIERRQACGLLPRSTETAVIDQQKEKIKDDLTGLACAGGGIRSASFCLGFLQALARTSRWETAVGNPAPTGTVDDTLTRFDYLSTVSGGGYTGAVLSAQAKHHADAMTHHNIEAVPSPTDVLRARAATLCDLAARELLPGGRQPLWQRLLHRGQLLGQAYPFLSRHIASTLVFNLALLSGLGFFCCLLSLLWRELDRPPLHPFLSWASNNQLIEFNRPFLIPAAMFTAYIIVVMSRRSAAWSVRLLAVTFPMVVFGAMFGLPYLMTLSTVLTLFGVVFTLFSGILKWTRDGRKQSQEFQRVGRASSWLLMLVVLKLFFIAALYWMVTGGGPASIEHLARSYWVMVAWTILLLVLEVKWIIAFGHPEFNSPHARLDRIMLMAAAMAALTGTAVWMSTPNMNLQSQGSLLSELSSGPNSVLHIVLGGIVALLLPFIRVETVLRSGMQARSTTQRWVFNMLSVVLLLGVPFLFVSVFARHNISGYANLWHRDLATGDVSWEFVVRRMTNEAEVTVPNGVGATGLKEMDKPISPDPMVKMIPAPKESKAGSPPKRYANHLKETLERQFRANFPNEAGPVVPRPEDISLTRLDPDSRPRWFQYYLTTWPAKILDETRIAIPADPYSWKGQLLRMREENKLMDRFSMAIRDKDFVCEVVKDPMIADWLQGRAKELANQKGTDTVSAAWRIHGRDLGNKLNLFRGRVEDRNFDREAPEFREDLETLGFLSFIAAHSDSPDTRPQGFVNRPGVVERDQLVRLVWSGLLLVLFLAAATTVNLNWVSPLAYYSRRLRETYLVPRSRVSSGEHPDPIDQHDPHLHTLENTRLGLPYHLIGCSVDVSDPRREPRRYQEYFLMSAMYVGSKALRGRGGILGFRETSCYQIVDRSVPKGVRTLRLSDVMAISGAAVTPLRYDNWLMRAILTVTNFRLGQWLPHPKEDKPVTATLANVAMDLPGVDDSMSNNRLVYIADGGFFDNLGLEALLDRRCAKIVVVDAGGDSEFLFADLCRVLQRAEFRGIRMTALNMPDRPLDLGPLLPRDATGKKPVESPPVDVAGSFLGGLFSKSASDTGTFASRLSENHFIVASIHYPDRDFAGTLVYVKPTLTGDEPAEVMAFRKSQPVFPHHSTAEQLFDWSMMNAYRRLGEHIGVEVAKYLNAPPLSETKLLVDKLEKISKGDTWDLKNLIAHLRAKEPEITDGEKLRRLLARFSELDMEIADWVNLATEGEPIAKPKKPTGRRARGKSKTDETDGKE